MSEKPKEEVALVDGTIYWSNDDWQTVFRRHRVGHSIEAGKEEADRARFLAIWKAGREVTTNPVDVAGYTLWMRNSRIEIWNYWTDDLAHTTEPVWKLAYDWAFDHSLIPAVPERCWPNQYPDGERPLPAKRRAKR